MLGAVLFQRLIHHIGKEYKVDDHIIMIWEFYGDIYGALY